MQAEAAGSFFQLVTELVKVETGLLMNDAVAGLESKAHVDTQEAEEAAGSSRRGTPGALYAAFHDQPQPGASSEAVNGTPLCTQAA